MKSILILGAGIYQVPLIKTAKRMGIHTIVTSIPGNYPGFELADEVLYENTVDYEAILRVAKEKHVDGIITTGTDVAVITIGKVCDELGLTGLSAKAAEIASNKLLMKQAYEAKGVRTAKFRQIPINREDYDELIQGLQYPLIFKSIDSSGSRGITRVDNRSEFDAARKNAIDNTRSDCFIIEEFIEGEEFGAQAYVQNGKVEFILPHGDYVFHGDTGVPIGHFAPYDLSDEVIEDVKIQLTGAIEAMELDNCAINADFILSNGKCYILEVGGRSGATCLAELVALYYDFDYYEKILRVALGEHVDFTPGPNAKDGGVSNACMLLTSDKDGVIESQHDDNPPNDDIVDVQFDYLPGDEVHKFHVGPHRIGHVITKGKMLPEAVDTLHTALENIHINVK
jgi:biotin carboxylase